METERGHVNFQFDMVDSQFMYSSEDIRRLADIFSQIPCRGLFGDRLMDINAIESYLEWARTGPNSNNYYLFLVRDIDRRIVGGCDVQRSSVESASIGFWKDENSRVSMKAVVEKVLVWCKDRGFVEIDAYTGQTNERAIRLLERIGFSCGGLVEGRTKTLMKFSRL